MLGLKSNKVVFYMLISFVSVLFPFSPQFVNSKPAISIYKLSLDPTWLALLLFAFLVLFDYDGF